MGEKENGIKLRQSYTGKVVNANIPENNKFLRIRLSNGMIDTLAFFGLRTIVEAGDSIEKVPNSYKYIIYKRSNPNDTIIFIGTNIYSK